MDSPALRPGLEVTISNGRTGVLYARTAPKRRHGTTGPDTWYFLPDGATGVGLVTGLQPREITEGEVASVGELRAGDWPTRHYRLSQTHRQIVYVACRQGRAPPMPAPGA